MRLNNLFIHLGFVIILGFIGCASTNNNTSSSEMLRLLVGTYEGSYTAGQGETGLRLTIFEERGNYKATFDFYNLPGRRNSATGSYYMNVSFDQRSRKYILKGYEWIVRPRDYGFADLEGTLSGSVFSGRLAAPGSNNYNFRVVRVETRREETRQDSQSIIKTTPVLEISNSWIVNNTATWIEAVNGIIRGGGNNKAYIITVTENITIPMSAENTFGSITGLNVKIEGNGSLTPSSTGSLLSIGENQTVIIEDVTFRGLSNNNTSLVVINKGTFQMTGSATITGNNNNSGYGGGINLQSGNLLLQDNAIISNNSSTTSGGGIYANGTLIMQDNATITGNNAGKDTYSGAGGGGVYVSGTFTMKDNAKVTGNNAITNNYSGGGGVCVSGTITIQDNATVSGNVLNGTGYGGGVCLLSGTFTIKDNASITNNRSVRGRGFNSGADGGGIGIGTGYYWGGTLNMLGGIISENTATGAGGGINIYRSTFTMSGGTITSNTASSGGGVYAHVYEGNNSFTMLEGTVSNNTASYGGGLDLFSGNVNNLQNINQITIKGGTIIGNTARENGGGIRGNYFNVSGGIITGNTAGNGGGISSYNGIFSINGGTISGNTATNNGGGIFVSRGCNFTKIGSTIHGNDATQNLRNTARNGNGQCLV